MLRRVQASNAAGEKCFSLARQWLQNCLQDHTQCQRDGGSFLFPTRVIAVKPESLPTDYVKLVQGENCNGQYAALSYCWGGERDLMLTHNTEPLLRRGLLLSNVTGTIRDAILVTRELGIAYLWVDGVCIFQDQERQESKDDWAREAGRMRDVYRGAVVTIEAAAATRLTEGFLKERKSSKPYCKLPWREGDETVDVFLRPHMDITDSQLLKTKVYTRGWTLQECLLAPRTLSYGTQQISCKRVC
jgi:hypothetical protein